MEAKGTSECLAQETVAAFLAGALDGAEVSHLEAHLARCATCAEVVADAAYATGDGTGPPPETQPSATTSPEPRPGAVLANKYRIEKLLGRGGMGSVFSAFHEELGHRVAIKVLHSPDSGAATRFIREARTTARLGGAHVPQVFDLGRLPGGAPYIVMEYLTGEDLGQVLARGPVSPSEAVRCVLQACAVLGPVHAAGVVHRDLKPANLFLVVREGTPPILKVLDFGVSKGGLHEDSAEAQSLTSTGTMVGSPMYMSPEQVRADKDVDARSDIWSLGVILYELVTGQRPFRGATLSALAVTIATGLPSRPSALQPGIPQRLELAILRCLEKDRSARFQSVMALSQAIAPFAEPDDAGQHVVRTGKRAPLAKAGAVAVGAVAFLAWAAFEISGRSPAVGMPAAPPAVSSPAPTTGGAAAPPPRADAPPPPATSPATSATATAVVAQPSATSPLSGANAHAVAAHGAPKPTASLANLPVPAPAPEPAASAPCKLVKTVDRAGESHFACPCATCQ